MRTLNNALAVLFAAMTLSAAPLFAEAQFGWSSRFEEPPGGRGFDYIGTDLEVFGGQIVAAGGFTMAGNNNCCNFVGIYPGIGPWTGLDCGMNAWVYDLGTIGADLYAGGDFTIAGGVPANFVARWNGTDWFALGAGVNNYVDAVGEYGGQLVAGGGFTLAGGSAANHVAVWDGTTWSALGSGIEDSGGPTSHHIHAIVEYGGDLYVGGRFDTAGGNAVTNLARWDGSAWSDFGATLTDQQMMSGYPVEVLSTVYDGTLLVGGTFDEVNGIEAHGLARWDGATWTGLGAGLDAGGDDDATVTSITVYNGELVVGGSFRLADGWSGLARWNGSSWQSFGAKFNYFELGIPVWGVGAVGNDLYVAGAFIDLGTTESYHIARYNPTGTDAPILPAGAAISRLQLATANPNRSGSSFVYSVERASTVDLGVFDAAGRPVALLASGVREAGSHVATWDGRNDGGEHVAAGVYFARFLVDGVAAGTQRVVLVR